MNLDELLSAGWSSHSGAVSVTGTPQCTSNLQAACQILQATFSALVAAAKSIVTSAGGKDGMRPCLP